MNRLIILLSLVSLFACCDCWQCVTGTIYTTENNERPEQVKITSYTRDLLTTVFYTDSGGKYRICTSNTGRCRGYLKITVEKEGYKTKEYNNPPAELDIILEKEVRKKDGK